MKPHIIIFLLTLTVVSFSQTKKKENRIWPMACIDYVSQNSNNFGFSVGPTLRFKRHTYIGILGGINIIATNKSSYISPIVFADYFYQLNLKKTLLGPTCRLGFNPYNISGQKDKYLFGDIGFRIYYLTIMGGYNFSLDNKDISNISKYRLTLRFP